MKIILATDSHRPDINRSAGQFVSRAIWGAPDRLERFCSVTVMDGDKPIAAIILHNWQPDCGVIEITAAGSGRWQSRRVINAVFRLCFDMMQCQTVAMRVAADHERMIENALRLGFDATRLPNMRGRGKDEWLFTLTDEAWKASRLYKPGSAGL